MPCDSPAAPPAVADFARTPTRVLLVEDDPEARALLEQLMRLLPGVEVVCSAARAQDAVAWLRAHPHGWDLALVDLFLGQGHGFDVLRHCVRRSVAQRVVLMSNYARDPVGARAMEAGADAFFDKSEGPAALLEFCLGPNRPAGVAPGPPPAPGHAACRDGPTC